MWNIIKSIFTGGEYSQYRKTPKEKIMGAFHDFIAYLTFDLNWKWVDLLISTLSDFEVNLRLISNKELFEEVDSAHIWCSEEEKTVGARDCIPLNTEYCDDCPFRTISKIAKFFYGNQSCGYCYYEGKGDYSLTNPSDLMWDGCKCCGENGYENYDAEEYEEEEITFESLGIDDYKEYYGN